MSYMKSNPVILSNIVFLSIYCYDSIHSYPHSMLYIKKFVNTIQEKKHFNSNCIKFATSIFSMGMMNRSFCYSDKESIGYSTSNEAIINKLFTNQTSHILFLPLSDENDNNNNQNPINCHYLHHNTYSFGSYDGVEIPPGTIIYSGSFNPLHEGHIQLALSATKKIQSMNDTNKNLEELLSQYQQKSLSSYNIFSKQSDLKKPMTIFEIPVINADKPMLNYETVIERICQFHPNHKIGLQLVKAGITNYGIVITSKPLFVQKSDTFKNTIFLVGADTFSRLIDPKYYHDKNSSSSPSLNLIRALTIIHQNGGKFVVGGRIKPLERNNNASNEKVFETLNDIIENSTEANKFISNLGDMFIGLTEKDFRVDLSSTEIRNLINKSINSD